MGDDDRNGGQWTSSQYARPGLTGFSDTTLLKTVFNFFVQRNSWLILAYLVVWICDALAGGLTSGSAGFWVSFAFTAVETAIAGWAIVAVVKIVREIG